LAKPTPARNITFVHGNPDGDLYSAEYQKIQKLF